LHKLLVLGAAMRATEETWIKVDFPQDTAALVDIVTVLK
jgi:hypothetical protein